MAQKVMTHVVSGELKAIEKLISVVKADGLWATKLVVDQGWIKPALPALKAWLDEHEVSFDQLEKPFFSTARGQEIAKHVTLRADYWVNHTHNSVQFVQAARAAHKSSSINVILDVCPQPTIWSNMQTPEFSEKSRLALTGKRGKNQIVALLSALSSLFEKGFSVEFSQLFSQMPHQFAFTQLPTNVFTTTRLTSPLATPSWVLVLTKSNLLSTRNGAVSLHSSLINLCATSWISTGSKGVLCYLELPCQRLGSPKLGTRTRHAERWLSIASEMLRAMDNVLALSLLLEGTIPELIAAERQRREEAEELRVQGWSSKSAAVEAKLSSNAATQQKPNLGIQDSTTSSEDEAV